MEYTFLMLFGCGFLGILIHNLRKIAEINKKTNGEFKAGTFFKIEWPSILLSVCIVVLALIIKSEIAELELAGKYLGFGFAFVGYGGQSIVFGLFGRIEKKIKKDSESGNPPGQDTAPLGEQ